MSYKLFFFYIIKLSSSTGGYDINLNLINMDQNDFKALCLR
jgi:hypothetical protein